MAKFNAAPFVIEIEGKEPLIFNMDELVTIQSETMENDSFRIALYLHEDYFKETLRKWMEDNGVEFALDG